MFKKIPELSTDPVTEKDGVRVEISAPLADGTTLEGWAIVRRAGGNNHHFARVAQALRKPFKYQLDNDLMAPEKIAELNRNILADACVVDFGGFPGEDGAEVKYSPANARALFEAYSQVYEAIAVAANTAANYRAASHNAAVEAAKNG